MALVLLLADGFEEIEALGTLDLLRRAGMEVRTASITPELLVRGAHGMGVVADCVALEAQDVADAEGFILPGGMGGATALAQSDFVLQTLREADRRQLCIAAICAAPALVLTKAGVLRGRKATCYPAEDFIASLGGSYEAQSVVEAENLITAAGPGCFVPFASALIRRFRGKEAEQTVLRDALMLKE